MRENKKRGKSKRGTEKEAICKKKIKKGMKGEKWYVKGWKDIGTKRGNMTSTQAREEEMLAYHGRGNIYILREVFILENTLKGQGHFAVKR